MSDLHSATAGEDVRVDYAAIEKTLAELWRGEKQQADDAVTRAALWNVVAHTANAQHHGEASSTLAAASAAVPQRTIIVRADPNAETEMSSWISANCHLVGGGKKQVCSEEIAIIAGGARVHRVPPLVSALLIPDMPVAVWWHGDLPNEHGPYVDALLDPADRLIVDSALFDSFEDLALIGRIAEKTTTAPADLNWVRLEEWRAATASVFDPPPMRARLQRVRGVRIVSGVRSPAFGEMAEALLFASWFSLHAGLEGVDYRFERRDAELGAGMCAVELRFDDGSMAIVGRDAERGILTTYVDGTIRVPDAVTRTRARQPHDLIVRQLKQPESDRVLLRVLPVAAKLVGRLAA